MTADALKIVAILLVLIGYSCGMAEERPSGVLRAEASNGASEAAGEPLAMIRQHADNLLRFARVNELALAVLRLGLAQLGQPDVSEDDVGCHF